MRLISKTIQENIHYTISILNEKHLARFVLSINYLENSNMTIVVFKTDSYNDYQFVCDAFRDTPISVTEYFS